MFQLNCGGFACPVCGVSLLDPVIGGNPAVFGADAPPVVRDAVGDVCPHCQIEYGVDGPLTFDSFRYLRQGWLLRNHWDSQAVDQIKENLTLTIDDLHREAEAVFSYQIALMKSRVADEPSQLRWRAYLGNSHKEYAEYLAIIGKKGQARIEYESAINAYQQAGSDSEIAVDVGKSIAQIRMALK